MKSRLPKERTQPIFISHGIHDEMAPVDMARRARDFLQEEGYTLSYNEYPISHEISEHVMADLVQWIKRCCPQWESRLGDGRSRIASLVEGLVSSLKLATRRPCC